MPELIGHGLAVYADGRRRSRASSICFRDLTTAVPSPLVCIVMLTAVSMYFGFGVRTVGDMGAAADRACHGSRCRRCRSTLETLRIILPYALTLAMVGPAGKPDDGVDRRRDDRHHVGQEPRMRRARASPTSSSGFFGGMARLRDDRPVGDQRDVRRARPAVHAVGRRVPAVPDRGARPDCVAQIPMAALVAVMIMVSINTFQWRSFKDLLLHPKSSSVVMLGTVAWSSSPRTISPRACCSACC